MDGKVFGFGARAWIRDAEGRVLVLRRSMSSRHFPGQWELPGGKTERGERMDETLLREIEEETGLVGRAERFVGAYQYELPHVMAITLLFEATVMGETVKLSEEHEAWRWATWEEFSAMDLAPITRGAVALMAGAAT